MKIDSDSLKEKIREFFCRPKEKECLFYETGGCIACPVDKIFEIIKKEENKK